MPQLRQLAEDYKDKGLVLIAPHSQEGTREQVVQLCKKLEMNYTVVASCQVKGYSGNKIPHSFVFNHEGKCVWDGNPGGGAFHESIDAAVEAAPDWILGPNDYEDLRKEAASVLARKSFGKTMASLRTLKEEGSETEKAEAARMFDQLDRYASGEWDRIQTLRQSRPSALLESLTSFQRTWKGDEYGDRATEELKTLKKDKEFKAAVQADGFLQKIEGTIDELKPCRFDQPLELATCDKCKQKNGKEVATIQAMAAQLLKQFPGTPAAEQIQATLTSLGISTP